MNSDGLKALCKGQHKIRRRLRYLVTLLGQAIARPANFINQELYGQPTTLPWGIPIDAAHRIGVYQDLAQFPLATTRFHPTFAYEMIWNFLAFALIIYISRRFASEKKLQPGDDLELVTTNGVKLATITGILADEGAAAR